MNIPNIKNTLISIYNKSETQVISSEFHSYIEQLKYEWRSLFTDNEIAYLVLDKYYTRIIHPDPYAFVDECEDEDAMRIRFKELLDKEDLNKRELLEAMMYGFHYGKYYFSNLQEEYL